MPGMEWALAIVRALAVAALLSAFGASVFRAWVLPRVLAQAAEAAAFWRPIDAIVRRSLVAAALLLPAWAVL